jgi:hypothetical protein
MPPGHFGLEEDGEIISQLIANFITSHISKPNLMMVPSVKE